MVEPNSFRARFCAHYQRAESGYEILALRKFLHWPWAGIFLVMRRVSPRLFATDLQIIQQLGRVTSGSNFSGEVRDIQGDYLRNRDWGWMRRYLKLRLSRERIFKASKDVWKIEAPRAEVARS